MRKILFVFVFVALTASVQSQVKNAIKFNLFSPLVKTGSFFYERVLTPSSSLNMGLLFTAFGADDTKVRGWALTPEYRFYLSDKVAPEGFYVAPYLRYHSLSFTNETEDAEADLNSIGGGLLVGRQWLFKERVTLDLFIGPSYSKGTWDVETGSDEDFNADAFEGFGVRAGVTLGIAF